MSTPSTTPSTSPTPRTAGPRTLAISHAQIEEREARDGEREARKELSDILVDQLKAERSRSANMTRIFVASFVLILMMLGVSTGLVKSGMIAMPGLGEVEVGYTDHRESIESPTDMETEVNPVSERLDENLYDEPLMSLDTGE